MGREKTKKKEIRKYFRKKNQNEEVFHSRIFFRIKKFTNETRDKRRKKKLIALT